MYNNHLKQADEYLDRGIKGYLDPATVEIDEGIYIHSNKVNIPTADKIKLLNYNPHPAIKAPLSVGK